MPDYEKMYHIMFNAATDAERFACKAAEILRKAQQECEELYLNTPDEPDTSQHISDSKTAGE